MLAVHDEINSMELKITEINLAEILYIEIVSILFIHNVNHFPCVKYFIYFEILIAFSKTLFESMKWFSIGMIYFALVFLF